MTFTFKSKFDLGETVGSRTTHPDSVYTIIEIHFSNKGVLYEVESTFSINHQFHEMDLFRPLTSHT